MTATEELRKLLDERGVEWFGSYDLDETCWEVGELTWVYGNDGNIAGLGVVQSDITPAQAIAATLGIGTCHNKGYIYYNERYFICSNCGCEFDYSNFAYEFAEHRSLGSPRYCPNCGAKVVD